ncbi:MAG: ATP-binding cassette domain-containing protein [Verrucomicrobia bacterium]|nr:ATP-binding cassette domain-containing protein [Verrucomicrobiota bacterium]
MSDSSLSRLNAPPPRSERLRQAMRPLAYKLQRLGRSFYRRILRKPRTVAESPNLLPLLIRVLAGFTNYDGDVHEDEIDSALDFLRHDYPETVYSELQAQFRQALAERPDLDGMAANLAAQLPPDRKILLGIQLYDLISRAGQRPDQVAKYYSFMSRLGMGAQAIDIVYQLNAPDSPDAGAAPASASPLEALSVGPEGAPADVTFRDFAPDDRLAVYRFHDLLLLKNLSPRPLVLEGRTLFRGAFGRLYPGQRVVVGERVLSHADLVAYFNAKKNVAVPVVFLAVDRNDEVAINRARTRDSALEIRFGLRVDVTALRDLNATLNGQALTKGASVTAALEDKIVFQNDTELLLSDLRRRARAMGGRFQLSASKSEYLVSNNPSLLGEDDILLSPGTGGEVLLKIKCDYDRKEGQLEVLEASRPIMVGETLVRNFAPLRDGDLVVIDADQSLRCDFTERILEEERNVIRTLEVRDVGHNFSKSQQAFDGISFAVERGEMVCVMGASGSGKSSLLLALAGHLRPQRGQVLLNGKSLYEDIDGLKKFISYIPQDDAVDEQLTIAENLAIAAALRSPHLNRRDRDRRIDGKLAELGLAERRNSIVGSPVKKSLSGGERKRLNIGLDMIGLADIYLFDEPTSGLSSKDSEHVIEIIRGMSHNKIVLVTIHQPSSKIFQMFQKVVLLDKGGRLVFFGTPQETLAYFAAADHQQQYGVSLGGCQACGTTRPEFIFDVLETPLRDFSGDIIYEENQRGQLVPARRFTPDFWRDKYESHRLLREMRSVPLKRSTNAVPLPLPTATTERPRDPIRWREEFTVFRTLLKRAFLAKMRNRVNLLLTAVLSPGLAALTGFVLRYSESGSYDFASAFHIATYIFIGLTVSMFFGLTNSVNDILRDRVILQRERNLQLRPAYYIASKVLVLALFALLQCLLFVVVGNLILEVRGMFLPYLVFMSLTAFCGVAIGLYISSVFTDAIAAVNILPLILIPQIIMSGALIKFEDMNRHLDFFQTLTRWNARQPVEKQKGKPVTDKFDSRLHVPFICQLMPMRWSYEALVVAQAKFNPLTSRQEAIQARINALARSSAKLTKEQVELLETDKELLAALSGLEGRVAGSVDRRLRRIDALGGKPLGGEPIFPHDPMFQAGQGVTAESLYVNQKISDMVAKSEMEQVDYRVGRDRNVFFSPVKNYFGRAFHVLTINIAVLGGICVIFLLLLWWSLWRQSKKI